MSDLRQTSIEIILKNQAPSGAYIASPNFPTYRYCWFRDSAFISYAMDLVGERDSAQRFHDWAALNIIKRADVVERAASKGHSGAPLEAVDILHTRYSLNGEDADEDWPNFQLDGFGTWLWSLAEHCRRSKTKVRQEWLDAAQLVADYLSALWRRPCFDCWEEFPEELHPYTLGAIYAGLHAHTSLNGKDHSKTLQEISAYLNKHAVSNGHLVKYIGSNEVDASLLGLAVPYRLKSPDDPLIKATVMKIETDLRSGGGVHRYAEDTYYGGGEWILLTAWLGWYYAQIGEWSQALSALKWIEKQTDEQGHLPEQVPASLIDRAFYKTWREHWGEIANPLLWSHAKYIVLAEALANQPANQKPGG